tara:strand:+ start:61 stop:1146 length:1086 start_codon:yes stop_codon:yes gene_type:complete
MKPENIGEKIKRIRKEKELSQSNLHSNQSAVSQIEKGTIKMPTSSMLRIIANNMDVSFDELIENTTWKPVAESRTDAEYAISQTQIDVKIEDWGEIKTTRKYYNAYDKHGVAQKYDPETGYRMITNCVDCNSPISKPDQQFCFSCGKKIFEDLNNDLVTWRKWYDSKGNQVFRNEYGYFSNHVAYSKIHIELNPIKNLKIIDKRISWEAIELHELTEFKRAIGNTEEGYHSIIETMQSPCNQGIFKNLVIKDGERYYTTEWMSDDEGNQQVILYKPNEKVDEKEISALVDIEYLQNFNPNEEHKMNKVFLPLWLEAMSSLSFSEGIIKELRRHKRRLETQQSIGQELEKEKSGKSKDEGKS